MRSRTRLLAVASALTIGFASIGVLHMPCARDLLLRAGGCPVGHARLSEIEPARHAAVAAERGLMAAPARPALGFELDRTTRDEARAWAERAGVKCEETREGLVRCTNVPARALGLPESDGPVGELYLGFNTRSRLVDVSTMRVHLARVDVVHDVESKLVSEVGAPQEKTGSFDEANLSVEGAQSLAAMRYRYSDYFADVIAMRFPEDGLVLREHYMSAAD